jgi:energy-coupling factor transporter ATP-binding protein EcfA2
LCVPPSSSNPSSSLFQLNIPSLEFLANKLTFVVGPVGSGKTSLLSVLTGEIKLLSGLFKANFFFFFFIMLSGLMNLFEKLINYFFIYFRFCVYD